MVLDAEKTGDDRVLSAEAGRQSEAEWLSGLELTKELEI